MFDFLKRLVGVTDRRTTQPTKRRSRKHRQDAADSADPIPVPEVLEGNEETDWDLWQDSVDSQAAPLSRSPTAYVDTLPSQLDDLDPYAKVRRNRDL